MDDHLFGKELFILFAASAFRKLSSIYVFSYFPFGFEGRIWDLIVSVPDNCLSFYFGINLVVLSLAKPFFLCFSAHYNMGITNHLLQLVFQGRGSNHYVSHVILLDILNHIQ